MQQPRKMLRIICAFSVGFDVASFSWTADPCSILHGFVIDFHQKWHRFLRIWSLKSDLKSMLILSSVFDHFLEQFSLPLGTIWAPLGAIFPLRAAKIAPRSPQERPKSPQDPAQRRQEPPKTTPRPPPRPRPRARPLRDIKIRQPVATKTAFWLHFGSIWDPFGLKIKFIFILLAQFFILFL